MCIQKEGVHFYGLPAFIEITNYNMTTKFETIIVIEMNSNVTLIFDFYEKL